MISHYHNLTCIYEYLMVQLFEYYFY